MKLTCSLFLLLLCQNILFAQSKDELQIRSILKAQEAAWNRADFFGQEGPNLWI
jgi:hypothetical protein